jgi:large subunit ribosomal protein L14
LYEHKFIYLYPANQMIQSESMVKVADNSGAKTAKVIRILGGSSTKFARIGDKVVVAVRSALPSSQLDK